MVRFGVSAHVLYPDVNVFLCKGAAFRALRFPRKQPSLYAPLASASLGNAETAVC